MADERGGKMEMLVIVGAGGHAAELHGYLRSFEPPPDGVALLGFIDDNRTVGPWLSSRILGPVGALPKLIEDHGKRLRFITAFGDNFIRRRVVARLAEAVGDQLEAWTLRHATAQTGYNVTVGGGTLLAPNVVVTSCSSIGRHCILNVKSSVAHDCVVGDFVNINPGATVCGSVVLGAGAYIGAGSVIKDKVRIGAGTIIGAGAVVVRDMPDSVTAVGVPARVLKANSRKWNES